MYVLLFPSKYQSSSMNWQKFVESRISMSTNFLLTEFFFTTLFEQFYSLSCLWVKFRCENVNDIDTHIILLLCVRYDILFLDQFTCDCLLFSAQEMYVWIFGQNFLHHPTSSAFCFRWTVSFPRLKSLLSDYSHRLLVFANDMVSFKMP